MPNPSVTCPAVVQRNVDLQRLSSATDQSSARGVVVVQAQRFPMARNNVWGEMEPRKLRYQIEVGSAFITLDPKVHLSVAGGTTVHVQRPKKF